MYDLTVSGQKIFLHLISTQFILCLLLKKYYDDEPNVSLEDTIISIIRCLTFLSTLTNSRFWGYSRCCMTIIMIYDTLYDILNSQVTFDSKKSTIISVWDGVVDQKWETIWKIQTVLKLSGKLAPIWKIPGSFESIRKMRNHLGKSGEFQLEIFLLLH